MTRSFKFVVALVALVLAYRQILLPLLVLLQLGLFPSLVLM
jgi:hypothetical protein